MTEIYLTPEEVCERLKGKIKAKTLANWRGLGIGPPFRRFGNRILYPEAGFEGWQKDQEYVSTAEYKRIGERRPGSASKGKAPVGSPDWWAERD